MGNIKAITNDIEKAHDALIESGINLRHNFANFILELVGGKYGNYIMFEEDLNISYPIFQDDIQDYSEEIYGVKIVMKDDVPTLLIYTSESKNFGESIKDEDNWFNPYVYGEFDEYEVYKFITHNYDKVKKVEVE